MGLGLDTQAVLVRYQEVTQLDPGVFWDWVELRRLYQDAGRLPAAREAARSAVRVAKDERDRSVAQNEEGDIAVEQGDLGAARARYQESLELRKRLAAADPSSASLQRDLWVSMWRLVKFPGSGVTWAAIATALEGMQRQGVLAPTDVHFLQQARRNAEAEKN